MESLGRPRTSGSIVNAATRTVETDGLSLRPELQTDARLRWHDFSDTGSAAPSKADSESSGFWDDFGACPVPPPELGGPPRSVSRAWTRNCADMSAEDPEPPGGWAYSTYDTGHTRKCIGCEKEFGRTGFARHQWRKLIGPQCVDCLPPLWSCPWCGKFVPHRGSKGERRSGKSGSTATSTSTPCRSLVCLLIDRYFQVQ